MGAHELLEPNFTHYGLCPICEGPAKFSAKYNWFRDHLICGSCESVPRERALARVMRDYYPNWRDLDIHESSPGGRGFTTKMASRCAGYSYSHYYPDLELGASHPESGIRNESIEALTFEDNSLDLFITQDVIEHIFNPEAAFKEIARVLKPGGAHIFTVPIKNKQSPSCRRAKLSKSGNITHLLSPPEYHGNPIDPKGALVTMDWGYDIAALILQEAGTPTVIFQIDDINAGIRAEYIDVLVSFKPEG